MQATTSQFVARATGNMRPLSWQLRMSFDKTFDNAITFFILNTSVLDGTDVLAPEGSDVIVQADKYQYTDYTHRLMSMEWIQQEDNPSSVIMAMADIVLENHDDYFTPNAGSAIEDFILPQRPIKLLAGFGSEDLPQFVGVTERMPVIDNKTKQASFHCLGFLSVLFNRKLDEAVLLQNVRTDEVLDYLFDFIGLTTGQYILDPGVNKIQFVFFEKNTTLGTAIDQLMEAEMGRLYMDEIGVIRFKNRQNFSDTPVYTFTATNTNEKSVSDESEIINLVRITADVRAVQSIQSVWKLSEPAYIAPGATGEIWADFLDPVTTADDPTSGFASTGSYFIARTGPENDSPQIGGVALTSSDLFSKSFKMVFTNSNSAGIYIQTLDIWGTPAKVINTVKVIESDQASIDKFEEQVREINNPFIQTTSAAQTIAGVMIDDYKDYGSIIDLNVKGTTALQLGDAITVDIDSTSGVYSITKITNSYANSKFTQLIKAKERTIRVYFVLDQSVLDGTDVLSP